MGPIRVLSTSVAWLPWGAAAFARARAERKPVLLSLTASWCQWCREMNRTSYADPTIATLVNERFVPVRVDAAERPDINERYSLGGWPTTAFLDADGAILGGGTFLRNERMLGALAEVLSVFDAQSDLAGAQPPRAHESVAHIAHLARRDHLERVRRVRRAAWRLGRRAEVPARRAAAARARAGTARRALRAGGARGVGPVINSRLA